SITTESSGSATSRSSDPPDRGSGRQDHAEAGFAARSPEKAITGSEARLIDSRAARPVMTSKVLSVSVGTPREFDYQGKSARSAIWKAPVSGRVAARGVNLAGDDQADRAAHGGYDKAIYAYAVEDSRWWQEKVGRP